MRTAKLNGLRIYLCYPRPRYRFPRTPALSLAKRLCRGLSICDYLSKFYINTEYICVN